MKKGLLLALFMISAVTINAQKDTVYYNPPVQKNAYAEAHSGISIYPVPVRENNFTVKSEKNISFIKITNIIGQDIYRAQYSNPQNIIRIDLNNPQRGMYLVTMIFDDNARVVRKIMIEQSE